jgi:Gpi18-like mannosyltransferase
MKKKDYLFIFVSFVVWRLVLLGLVFLSAKFFPLQNNFLGGGLGHYLKAPLFWAWANFDGEHYLSIAQNGYGFGEQAFFPLYPLLIKFVGMFFGGGLVYLNLSGLLIANISFLIALIGMYKLFRLDFSERISKWVIIFLLLFPTSFYFGSVYTESLFLVLIVWSFYFARKGNWLGASILAMFASATRVIGIILLPILAIELLNQNKFKFKGLKVKNWLPFLIIPLGLFFFMFYLKITTGDWLAFLHALPSFGEQRSATPIVLPQVFYRYIFKILPNLNYVYFPGLFTTYLEFITGIVFLALSILSFFKLRLSYSLFLLGGYLIPTLSGSFSSLPRYLVILFPAFILIGTVKLPKLLKATFSIILFIGLVVSIVLFSRGYWLS